MRAFSRKEIPIPAFSNILCMRDIINIISSNSPALQIVSACNLFETSEALTRMFTFTYVFKSYIFPKHPYQGLTCLKKIHFFSHKSLLPFVVTSCFTFKMATTISESVDFFKNGDPCANQLDDKLPSEAKHPNKWSWKWMKELDSQKR